MKAHEFISRLDEARYGRRVSEDTKPVAAAPSHAPTHTAQWKTDSQGKSDDQGEHTGPSGDAIKQSKHSIPTPVAPPPSHAPTSGKDYTTTGKGGSEDQGEKVSKEAIKETVRALIDGDGDVDVAALLGEGGHKAGCQCGFCKNKGKMGKKQAGVGEPSEGEKPEKAMKESYAVPPVKRRLGGERMGFRSPITRPKMGINPGTPASINPNQPAMERLDRASNSAKAIQEMADELLEAPDRR